MRILIVCAASILSMFSAVTAQQVDFSVKMNTYRGGYAPRNVFALWITDARGRYIKSLRIAGNKQYSPGGYRHCLWLWTTKSLKDTTDAITSASMNTQGIRSATWDCTDKDGNEVADGTYRFYYEMCESNGYNYAWSGPNEYIRFNKGVSDTVINGDDTWFTDGWPGNPDFGTSVKVFENAKLTYTAPVANVNHGSGYVVENIDLDVSVTSGALAIKVSGSRNVVIGLFNAAGRRVAGWPGVRLQAGLNVLNMDGLAHGIYILKINSSSAEWIHNVAVIR